jgi:hypothetical protein
MFVIAFIYSVILNIGLDINLFLLKLVKKIFEWKKGA